MYFLCFNSKSFRVFMFFPSRIKAGISLIRGRSLKQLSTVLGVLKKGTLFFRAILTTFVRFVKSFGGKGVGTFQLPVPNPVEKAFSRTLRVCETEATRPRFGIICLNGVDERLKKVGTFFRCWERFEDLSATRSEEFNKGTVAVVFKLVRKFFM